ncbi:hypothetical protein [Pseudomonas ovata]|uniref:hypothetical protein n=1 Tax=Pseudomonas ovata TaxID=1839709 RepID=UPI000D68FBFB|nr:hypothetical protein [Pseudomonas ovata]
MSDKYIRGYHGDVVLAALPCEHEVACFTEHYTAYLETAREDEQSSKNLGTLLQIIGVLLALVGLVGLGGPSTIQVGPGGLTFIQLIQLFPGPLMTLGFFLITIGAWIGQKGADPALGAEEYLLKAWRIKMSCGHYCEEPLVVTATAPDTFGFALASETAGDTASA